MILNITQGGAGEYSKQPGVGNFVELINYAIRRGDKTLEDHNRNHPSNRAQVTWAEFRLLTFHTSFGRNYESNLLFKIIFFFNSRNGMSDLNQSTYSNYLFSQNFLIK